MFHCSSIVLALGKKKFTWNCKNPCPIVLNCNYLPDPSSSCALHSHIPNTPSRPPHPPGHMPSWSTTWKIKLAFHWLTPSSQQLPEHSDFVLSSRDERCWPSGSYSALTGKQWRRRRALSADAGSHPPCLVIPVRARTMYNCTLCSVQNPPCLVICVYNVHSASFVCCLHNVQYPPCFVQNVQNLLYLGHAQRTLRVLANQGVHDVRSAHCALCCVAKWLATLHCCGDGV